MTPASSNGRRRDSAPIRVVITGLGAISPLGLTVHDFWDGLTHGRSGIGRITQFDASGLPCQIAGEIRGFDPKNFVDHKDARRMARCSQIAVATAREALTDAGLIEGFADPERVGVLLGSAIGGLDRLDEGARVLRTRGVTRVSPFSVPESVINMPAHHISKAYRVLGPLNTCVTACAAGTQAVGEAAEVIRRGVADVMITGGVEAAICDLTIAGFVAMRAMPTSYNDAPERSSRPFDKHREGFVFSEGCAILILERLEHALARGAKIYAEVMGYASSSDAYHVAAPDPSGAGAIRAMKWALKYSGVRPEEISYINAHGSSTPLNDANETAAIKHVFGEQAYNIPVSSTKSMIGHPMGASGALEAAACALSLYHQLLHPTINYETPDPDCDLDYVPNVARPAVVNYALSNSFGLGGQNACLVLRRYQG
ncbi:MAG: beta-ketoacyl-ACP synthase II [Anaerolineales bacterium]|nr:beta-ketoacyl-ACP synthase II [Anaerolineales bacterium]